jgi:hypothetical protein
MQHVLASTQPWAAHQASQPLQLVLVQAVPQNLPLWLGRALPLMRVQALCLGCLEAAVMVKMMMAHEHLAHPP